MIGGKGQIALEYFILTVFILIAVSMIFAFSFLNYDQNSNIVLANETMSKLSKAVNVIYGRGKGNTTFVSLSLPNGLESIEILHKCKYPPPKQGTLAQCRDASGSPPADYGDVNFSIIKMGVRLLGGTSTVLRKTNAVIWENLGEISSASYAGSKYPVRVSWNGNGQIKLEKV
jgi:hypothetical protein